MNQIKKVVVILNPGASPHEPILSQLNSIFTKHDIKWDIKVSQSTESAVKLTTAALRTKTQAVAVYGGDGTVLAVASVLAGTDMPLIIIPGGTANVMAKELGVPTDNLRALHIFARQPKLKLVDVVNFDQETPFFLRVEAGVTAKMVTETHRKSKNLLGIFAYPITAIQKLVKTNVETYHLELDGVPKTVRGVGLMVANCGNLGVPGLSIRPNVDHDDGILDVFVLTSKKVGSLMAVGSSTLRGSPKPLALKHWKVKKVSVTFTRSQKIVRDDLVIKTKHFTAEMTKKQLKVLT